MVRRIGVLALQGAFREHIKSLERCGADAREIRTLEDLKGLDGVVLPGGESTVMGKLLTEEGLMEPLRELCLSGIPVLGTCAGMILLAKTLPDYPDQPRLGLMDISVIRNAFGRQVDSFECQLDVKGFEADGDDKSQAHAVFIRAPLVKDTGDGVEVLARVGDHPVAVRTGSLLALSFHPELTSDLRFHRWMVS